MGKPKIALGIEVGDHSLKLALHDRSQKKIARLGLVQVPQHPLRDLDFLERTIAEWLEPYPQAAGSAVCLSIPARMGVVRLVEIPPDVPDIRDYVEWEFGVCVGEKRSDYWMDFQVLPGRDKKSRIAVVGGIRRAWLEPLRKGFARRDLIPGVVELDAFSLINLIELGVGYKKELFCAVKVDTTGVILVWGDYGVLRALRWVSVSALTTMTQLEAFESLAKDLTRELYIGFEQLGILQAAGQIVHLCGDLAVHEDFVAALRRNSPDFLYHLLDSFPALRMDPQFAKDAPLCATAIGASYRYRGDHQ